MAYYVGDEDELDLHGYRVREALERFVVVYNSRVRSDGDEPLVVVHGYGSSGEGGKIRKRLRDLLDMYPDRLEYEVGELVGNPGMTMVFPGRALPTTGDRLEQDILSYCSKPRTRDKIAGKFRRYGQPEVLSVLRKLEGQGELEVIQRGSYRCYKAQ